VTDHASAETKRLQPAPPAIEGGLQHAIKAARSGDAAAAALWCRHYNLPAKPQTSLRVLTGVGPAAVTVAAKRSLDCDFIGGDLWLVSRSSAAAWGGRRSARGRRLPKSHAVIFAGQRTSREGSPRLSSHAIAPWRLAPGEGERFTLGIIFHDLT